MIVSAKLKNGSESLIGASAADIAVFVFLELFAVMAMIGNSILVIVILRNKYLDKPSFILIFSLGLADILHGIVTSTYFYPPILLRHNHFSELAYRVMNVIDWTAWGISISHMAAIGIDRLLAIVMFHRYPQIMTVWRTRAYSILCWTFFLCTNTLFFLVNFCCPIVPVPEYYTFDYQLPVKIEINASFENETLGISNSGFFNIYPYMYTPLEITVLVILAISNPITLIRLHQKYKRKRSLQVASRMLLSMACTQSRDKEVLQAANKQQFLNRDVRIFIQITTVTVIFFCYMFIYYLFFYIVKMADKWSAMFNSFFYSTTHMINPIIYFSLNMEMRAQMLNLILCRKGEQPLARRKNTLADLRVHDHFPTERQPLLGSHPTMTPNCSAVQVNSLATMKTQESRVLEGSSNNCMLNSTDKLPNLAEENLDNCLIFENVSPEIYQNCNGADTERSLNLVPSVKRKRSPKRSQRDFP